MSAPVGLVLGSAIAPERLPGLARLAEELGYGELWFAEDYFFTGGISGAVAALGATRHIPVGLGVVSAMVRHPAVLAMELATTARVHPGRLRGGIGLGVPAWLRQMGLQPRSSLTAMRECVTTVRALLDGQEVTLDGRCFTLDRVRLTYVPDAPVPLYTGVLGPKMMRLSGEIADGNVLSVLSMPAYVRWARERVEEGARAAGRTGQRGLTAFAFFAVGADGVRAKRELRPSVAFYLAAGGRNALTDAYGISEELEAMLAAGGATAVEREMPDRWLDDLAVAGDPDECAEKVRRLLDAGADSVVLFPMPSERSEEMVRVGAADVLPRVFS
jgi:alkanesulfonate monooxygenase SsuD/methylene tetrahydromethanopterin reductase-like flavin-dependent oxidoreductase (luciferase family)